MLPLRSTPALLALCAASLWARGAEAGTPGNGKIVVANDEWTLSDTGFASAPTTAAFVTNLCSWFSGGTPGTFLAYSSNFGLTENALRTAVEGAGHSWTVSTAVPFDTSTLLAYDGVFLGGPPALNTQVLIDYVAAGGSVYLMGGTVWPGDATAQAAAWNPFLNAFGLGFGATYNQLCGTFPASGAHPIQLGVDTLYQCIGQGVVDTDPSDPRGQVVVTNGGEGLYAVFADSGGDGAICPYRGTILFERPTDTISIAGNTVLGAEFTAEAVVLFCGELPVTNGVVFQEQYDQLEDKALIAWGGGLGGTAQTGATPSSFVVTPLAISLGDWHHIAFVADGTEQRVYLDGVLIGSRPVSGDIDDEPASRMSIGAFVEPLGGEFRGAFTGLMDSLRISNVARYTGPSFVAPTGDLSADGATLLLFQFTEAPGSPTVADSSGNGFTGTLGAGFAGATAPRLAVPPCCPQRGWIEFDRPTDTISIPGNTVLEAEFTAEALVLFCGDLPVTNGVVFQEQYDQLEDKALIAWGGGLGGTAQTGATPSSFVVTPLAISLGDWHHIAFVADGSEQRVYLDGVLIGARPVSGDIDDTPASRMSIGAFVEPLGGEFRGAFTGLMDSLRISNVARYSGASFVPPAGDLPNDGPTLLLYHFDEAPGSATVIDRSGNGWDGILGEGFDGATPPRLAAGRCLPEPTGTPLCFGDGTGTPCPCANPGGPGAGCANGTGAGGLLGASGTASVSNDSMSLTATGVINNSGLFFQGNNAIGGGAGIVFGDGLRCCGSAIVRIQVVNPPGSASPATAQMTETATANGAPGTIVAGGTKCYQYWYRDPATSPCGAQFNLTNAVSVTWQP